jgi:site-specific recombinase XerD
MKRGKHSLNLSDLDNAKSPVLNSLPSKESQRGYRHSIDEFINWYCSEPRLSFNRAVVTRYRIHLESRHLAPGTINARLAAVRRLAYEAADSGLLSPDLAAGIRRVKGPKNLGIRLGNWLTAEQAKALWQAPDPNTLKGKRDRALLGVLLGCGLRRREAAELEIANLQRREDHWPQLRIWPRTTSVGPAHVCARDAGGDLDQIQFLLGQVFVQTTERYLGCKQRLQNAVNDRIGIEPRS